MADGPLVKKLAVRDRLNAGERRRLEALATATKQFKRGEDIVSEGARPAHSSLLLEGFCCRYNVLPDGRRQISAIHVAGDFVDLHSYLIKEMDHGVAALSPCRIALVPHQRLTELTRQAPHLTRMLWLSTLIDSSIFRQWITSLGRRSAVSRVAHLFCEVYLRLETVGLTDGLTCAFPLTQRDIADSCGLSIVHANRTLGTLRKRKLATIRRNWLEIGAWDRLAAAAEFDPQYLHLDLEPR
jgi:CRP-like cAMP-binding protein